MGFYQSSIPPTSPQTNLSGQTIIITGATAGLGREASLQLLRLRASTVILGVRNTIKGNAVRAQLLADEEVRRVNGQADVKVLRLDLADYASVVEFADRVIREIGSLDVLLLNAGINLARFERSVSGHEMFVCPTVNEDKKEEEGADGEERLMRGTGACKSISSPTLYSPSFSFHY